MEERAWYIVQTASGCENVAKKNIERRAESMYMTDLIFRVLVPEEKKLVKKKNGTTKEEITHPYPGYVFIDMIVTDESWFMVRNTPMVTGFLGSSGGGAKPVPLLDEEMLQILKSCGISTEKEFAGKVGDTVRVTTGTMSGQEGVIENIDTQKGTVRVLLSVFGRATPTELNFNEVVIL